MNETEAGQKSRIESRVASRIVAIHGFLGRATDWDALKSSIHANAPHVDFQAVDLFSSISIAREKNMTDWAKKFNRAQKNKHVERNILVGYSLGGRLALQAALDKPGLWDEVVLISAHPGSTSEDEKLRRRSSDKDWANKFLNLPWADVVRLWNSQPVFVGSNEPLRAEKDYSRESLAAAILNWSLAGQDFAGERILSLKPKLHWVAGEKDGRYMDLFQTLKIEGFIEDLSVVKGATHRVLFDNPVDLARLLVQKLKLE